MGMVSLPVDTAVPAQLKSGHYGTHWNAGTFVDRADAPMPVERGGRDRRTGLLPREAQQPEQGRPRPAAVSGKMVNAGGNAPLVGFRNDFTTTGLQSAIRIGAHFELRKLVASPGNAPGLRGYEPQVESSRLAIWNKKGIGRGSRSRTCFLMLPRHPSPLLRPHRVVMIMGNEREWWRRRDLHPPHAACKAASPLWNMHPHWSFQEKWHAAPVLPRARWVLETLPHCWRAA